MKTWLSFLRKLIVSGILAVFILCVFCMFYDNSPIAIEQPDQYTNYKFKPKVFWSQMTEGLGFGWTNNIGYNSMGDADCSDPVIAFLGSSHTEAFQVKQGRNFVSLIQTQLQNDTDLNNDYPCVNLGISAHAFNVCVSKFSECLDAFDNAKYVVIESGTLNFTEEELDKMLEEAYHDPYKDKGMINNLLRHIPFVRTLKNQYEQTSHSKSGGNSSEEIRTDYEQYESKISAVIQKLSAAAAQRDVRLIIFYHNTISVAEDGVPVRMDDPQLLKIFRESCEDEGVCFVDATERFLSHYRENYEMPYGFANTMPGVGHLNETGHRIIAQLLYDQIMELS